MKYFTQRTATKIPPHAGVWGRANEPRGGPLDDLVLFDRSALESVREAPPSGDKCDYMSQARYWWPNPDTEDGLPYVERDGRTNPETWALDHPRFQRLVSDVRTLTLAQYFTGEDRYGSVARDHLVTWFLDPERRMNSHLRYAQRIPGRSEGGGVGILDTRGMRLVVEYVRLLAEEGVLSAEDEVGIRAWVESFVDWLLESDHGDEAATFYNNHATWYPTQELPLLLFVGRLETAGTLVCDGRLVERHIVSHIEPDGSQAVELARERPVHYGVFNLRALCSLASVATHFDRYPWSFEKGRRSVRAAVDWVADAVEDGSGESAGTDPLEPQDAYVVFLRAAERYGDDRYRRLARSFLSIDHETLERRLLHEPLEPNE